MKCIIPASTFKNEIILTDTKKIFRVDPESFTLSVLSEPDDRVNAIDYTYANKQQNEQNPLDSIQVSFTTAQKQLHHEGQVIPLPKQSTSIHFQNQNSLIILQRDGTLLQILDKQMQNPEFGRSVSLTSYQYLYFKNSIIVGDRDGVICTVNGEKLNKIENIQVVQGYVSEIAYPFAVCESGVYDMSSDQMAVKGSGILSACVHKGALLYIQQKKEDEKGDTVRCSVHTYKAGAEMHAFDLPEVNFKGIRKDIPAYLIREYNEGEDVIIIGILNGILYGLSGEKYDLSSNFIDVTEKEVT